MTAPARRPYTWWGRLVAIAAGIACIILGFVCLISSPHRADPLVCWALVSAGVGLIALALPL